jgi:biotin carboxyl carrier protein
MKKLRITVDGKSYEVTVERLDDEPSRSAIGTNHPPAADSAPPVKQAATPRPRLHAGAITSPMAGVVLSVAVKKGDDVERDQLLLILEAMKMENQILAPALAVVTDVHVKAGESVTEGQLLMELG